jgi:molecular chaperone DnaK
MPQIEVTFDIDANGIIHVSAKDLGTGKEQSMKIQAPTKLSKEEIEKMVKQAEQFAETDRKKKEGIEAKNVADALIYQTEKELQEFGSKLDDAVKADIAEKIADLKKAVEGGNTESIAAANEALNKARTKLGEAVYKQSGGAQGGAQGGPQGPQGEAGGKKPDDNVVDADFKVEDEKK